MVMKDNTRILLAYLAQTVYANPNAYPIDEIFEINTELGGFSFNRIVEKFDRYDIEYDTDTILTDIELKEVLSTRFSSSKGSLSDFNVDTQELVREVKVQIDKLRHRDEIIKNFANVLKSNGLSYRMIFSNFLGIKSLYEAELTPDQIRMMFKFMKFQVKEDDFRDFIETLSEHED
jgi:t-SNARE complex subunit (syntaxin)